MDYSNFAPHAQPYQFFVPTKTATSYTTQEDTQYNLDAFSHQSNYQPFFDQHAPYPPPSIIPPAPAQSPSNTNGLPRSSLPHTLPQDASASLASDMSNEVDFEQAQGRSSDEEKESLTPAQSRRKAQNRAAQRAFRERKERHVKDLELKLKSMEARSTDLVSDNERLKRELERVAAHNEILRATSSSNPHIRSSSSSQNRRQTQSQRQRYPSQDPPEGPPEDQDGNLLPTEEPNITSGPTVYSPRTFSAAFSDHHAPRVASTTVEGPVHADGHMTHRIAINNATGERLLSTGAAWEYIQHSDLFQKGVVDLGEVVDRLRERVICDGAGPSFAESEVRKAIEESVGAVGDELI